jgi:glucosamine--fructose-6-phosphate aminotransferase (isomerizing)
VADVLGRLMEAEIREQPRAFAAAVAAARAVDVPRPTAVVLFARGTSDNAALYGRYVLEGVAGLPVMLGAPSLANLYDAPTDLSGWLAVSVSQSGATREIADCLAWAEDHGAATLAVTNEPASLLASVAAQTVVLGSGPERAVAATKTYTAECAALAALAYAWSERTADWPAVQAALDEAAQAEPDLALAEALGAAPFALVLGRGFGLPLAHEIALKLMEACGVWATGMSWADLLHGPIAAVPEGTSCLVLPGGAPLVDSAHELTGRLERAGIRARDLPPAAGTEALEPALRPLVDALPAQLAVLAAGRSLGHDPDAPAGLTKVTQT